MLDLERKYRTRHGLPVRCLGKAAMSLMGLGGEVFNDRSGEWCYVEWFTDGVAAAGLTPLPDLDLIQVSEEEHAQLMRRAEEWKPGEVHLQALPSRHEAEPIEPARPEAKKPGPTDQLSFGF